MQEIDYYDLINPIINQYGYSFHDSQGFKHPLNVQVCNKIAGKIIEAKLNAEIDVEDVASVLDNEADKVGAYLQIDTIILAKAAIKEINRQRGIL